MDDPRRAGPGQATFTFFYLHRSSASGFYSRLGQATDYHPERFCPGSRRHRPRAISSADRNRRFRRYSARETRRAHRHRRPQAIKRRNRCQSGERRACVIQQSPSSQCGEDLYQLAIVKEGQTVFARANGYVSARLDVPTDHAEPWRVPQPGAIKTYTKAAMQVKDNLMPLLIEVFGNP